MGDGGSVRTASRALKGEAFWFALALGVVSGSSLAFTYSDFIPSLELID